METDGPFGILKLFIILINVLYHEITKKKKINTMGVEHSNTYEIRNRNYSTILVTTRPFS
jgi:hypothetical protein